MVTVTNAKENNSLVTVIEAKIADIIRNLANYASLGFTVKDDVCLLFICIVFQVSDLTWQW